MHPFSKTIEKEWIFLLLAACHFGLLFFAGFHEDHVAPTPPWATDVKKRCRWRPWRETTKRVVTVEVSFTECFWHEIVVSLMSLGVTVHIIYDTVEAAAVWHITSCPWAQREPMGRWINVKLVLTPVTYCCKFFFCVCVFPFCLF